MRSAFRSHATQHYLVEKIEQYAYFAASSAPQQLRKGTLRSLSKSFNDGVMIGHLFLDGICMLHANGLLFQFVCRIRCVWHIPAFGYNSLNLFNFSWSTLSVANRQRKYFIALAFRISNDHYGSDTILAFEWAKGFTHPISAEAICRPYHRI